jgi:hypothetical protein
LLRDVRALERMLAESMFETGSVHMRDLSPRVRFGERWVETGALDLFQENIARFRVLLTREVTEDSLDVLDSGGVPELQALSLHNGTVYRGTVPATASPMGCRTCASNVA